MGGDILLNRAIKKYPVSLDSLLVESKMSSKRLLATAAPGWEKDVALLVMAATLLGGVRAEPKRVKKDPKQ